MPRPGASVSEMWPSSISTPSADTRTDRVILRSSWAAQTTRIAALENPSEGTGTPPALTQTDKTTWEIPLATLTVTTGGGITVSDTREFIHIGASRTRYIVVSSNGGLNVTAGTGLVHADDLGVLLQDLKVIEVYGHFTIPSDFVDDLSVRALVGTGVGITGDFYGTLTVDWASVGEAPNTNSLSTGPAAVEIALGYRNNAILEVTPATADLDPYDIFTLTLQRDSVDALDTIDQGAYCIGFLISYTADQ